MELSRREKEVAALVADGLTDKEIARSLFLSPRTVEGHVQAIRNKLGLDNRAQVAAWWIREGTVSPRPSAALPAGLPAWLTIFVGRSDELERIPELLARNRSVTITGPGGAGKTRLALRLAMDLAPRLPALWFVDLSTIREPELVLPAVATALGRDEFEGMAGLVVLDNCEHVIERAAEVAFQLLKASAKLQLLATSREPLLFDGEAVWKLEALPAEDAESLFAQRANLSDPDFEVSAANADLVSDLCRRLDGIPLALELAAAQVGPLGLEGVRDHIDALRRRAGPARHQTLEAAIGWSHDLLPEPEQRLLRRLAVFRGGFSEEAAAAVCGEEDVELLPTLAQKSLLVAAAGGRWGLLETIREFAAARLEASGEAAELRERHGEYFRSLAESAVLSGAAQAEWLPRLEAEHDNFRAALAATRDPHLAVALNRFWLLRGHLSEGRAWLEQVGGDEPEAHNAIAGIAWRQGDYAHARDHLLHALAGWEKLGDTAGQQRSLANLGVLASSQGDFAKAVEHYRLSLALAEQPRALAILKSNLGLALAEQGSHAEAEQLLGSALVALRDLAEPALIGATLANLGVLELNRGRLPEAKRSFLEALEVLQAIGDTPDAAGAFEGLACVEALNGDRERALELVAQAVEIRQAIGSSPSAAQKARLERYALQV